MEICEAIYTDLIGTSNHTLNIDCILIQYLDKASCICTGCVKIRKVIIKLMQTLHNEVVFERMRDTLYITEHMKRYAT